MSILFCRLTANFFLMTETFEERLKAWFSGYVGPDRKFKNVHAWALAAGIANSTMDSVAKKGIADPLTLIRLARSVGESPLEMLKQQGVLRPEEVDTPALAPPENELVELYRALAVDPVAQESFLEGSRIAALGYRRLLEARASGALD